LERGENYRWVILTIVYLSILAFTFAFQLIPPILPLIIPELRLTYSGSGLLMSLFALPGLFISLPGGFLSDRYPMGLLGMIGFLLMIGGTLLVGWGADFWTLGLGRIVTGIGALTLSILLPKMISQWFRGKEIGLAMGIFNTGVPLGSVISFSLFGRIGNLWGWRLPVFLTGIYFLAASLLFLALYRPPSRLEKEDGKRTTLMESLKEMGSPIWWIGMAWLWFNAAFISFATFAPVFFVQNGYTIEKSGLLIGIPPLGSVFLSPLVGYLVDRFRKQESFIILGSLALSILSISFISDLPVLFLVVMMALFSAMVPSPIYSLPPEILRPEHTGLGFGVISTCSSIGLFAGPYLVGKAKDLTGSDHWTFGLISLFFFLISISILFARRSQRED
jgi:predicted MFS family arabinose efflux permease